MIILTVLAGLAIFYFLNLAAGFLVIRHFLFEKPGRAEARPHESQGFIYRSIQSGPRRLDAQILQVPGPAPLIVICHGQGETVGMWSGAQKLLAGRGVSSLVFDYSGFGESSHNRRIAPLIADVQSVLAAIDELFPLRRSTWLLGFSLGCALLLRALGSSNKQYDKILLCEPFYSVRELATGPKRLPGRLKWLVADILNNREPLKLVGQPVHLMHSVHDDLAPFRHSELLHQAAPGNTVLHRLAGYAHNDIWKNPSGGYWEAIIQEINR